MARKMKDSGIEWIGEIPEGWEVVQLKRFAEVHNGREIDVEVDSTDSSAVGVYGSGGVFKYTNRAQYSGKAVLFGRKGTLGKPLYVEGQLWAVDTMYFLTYSNRLLEKFSYYQFLAFNWAPYITHTAIPSVVASEIVACYFPIPPLEEQAKIVDYLDNGCASLDTILDKTRSSIEEYKKLKQAVITQAVTKGVRGKREIKDSGVEWIGAIPKDWEIKRLKSFCTIVDCKNRTPDVFPDGKYTVVRTTCIKDCSFSYEGSYQTDTTNFKAWTLKGQPHKGDIFFTREAPVGEACLVPNADNLCMGQRVMFFRPEDNSDARYIMYSIYGPLVREYIASKNSGSTVGHLKLGQVACIPIFYCPPLEQKEIADYLDAKCAEIDGLIAKKEQLIKELESYKKSLIYEVVTGKREV